MIAMAWSSWYVITGLVLVAVFVILLVALSLAKVAGEANDIAEQNYEDLKR